MMPRLLILAVIGVSGLAMLGCAGAPGRPQIGETPVAPSEITDFGPLYQQNCAGCHGIDGKGGAAIDLDNPVYLAIADDAILLHATANGVPGTSMPAFAQSAGGMLTDQQVHSIVSGIRERWSQPDFFHGADPPPYSSPVPGDAMRGSQVYAQDCSSCHGAAGRGGPKASSIVDGSFLALVSDQELRTIVIAGRPDLGDPDWRSDVPGTPLTEQNISDVVAWIASQRPRFPGQPFPTSAKPTGDTR
jgi:cytochrome c oxidase cbb3-type subunit 3